MNSFYTLIKAFPFKNVLAIPLMAGLLYAMLTDKTLHDSGLVLLTLVVKYYYDTSNQSAKKDETISAALTAAQNTPGVPTDPAVKA